jgi:hypothetical protein
MVSWWLLLQERCFGQEQCALDQRHYWTNTCWWPQCWTIHWKIWNRPQTSHHYWCDWCMESKHWMASKCKLNSQSELIFFFIKKLVERFGNSLFKIGESDSGRKLKVTLKEYI